MQTYVGAQPTAEEKEHFGFLSDALLMVIAVNRFKRVSTVSGLLSRKDMEELLNSAGPLPSVKLIPTDYLHPKLTQLSAVYALHEFLNKSQTYS